MFEDSFTPAPTPTYTPASSTASKFFNTPTVVPPHASTTSAYVHVPASSTATAPAPYIETSATEAAPAPANNLSSVCFKTKSSKSSSPDPLTAEALVMMMRKAETIGKLNSCYINYSQMLYIKLILNFI